MPKKEDALNSGFEGVSKNFNNDLELTEKEGAGLALKNLNSSSANIANTSNDNSMKNPNAFLHNIISDKQGYDTKEHARFALNFTLEDAPPAVFSGDNTIPSKKLKRKQRDRISSAKISIFFILLISAMIFVYKELSKGIHISLIDIAGVSVNNAFLQLNERLTLQIDSINVDKEDDEKPMNLSTIFSGIKKTLYVLSYFDDLRINKISINGEHYGSVFYHDDIYQVETPFFDTKISINDNTNNIRMRIEEFLLKKDLVQLSGDIIYSIPQKQLLFQLKALKNKDSISINGMSDFKILRLKGSSTDISNLDILRPYVNSLSNTNLRNVLNKWIFDDITYQTLRIDSIDSEIALNNIAYSLLHKTIIKGRVRNVKVTLNSGVKPITSKEVLLEYNDASLTILPQNAEFANMDLNDSKVVIANMPKSSVYITLNGRNVRADSNLHKLLNSYHISIPVKQEMAIKKSPTQKRREEKDILQDITITENKVIQAIEGTPKGDSEHIEGKINSIQSELSKNNNNAQDLALQDPATKLHISAQSQNTELYNKILELNPNTTLTNQKLYNASNDDKTSMHLKISIEHNEKNIHHPLFSIQGVIQGIDTKLELYNVPIVAKDLNVVLDITPKQKLIYVNANKAKWKNLLNADVNVLIDMNKESILANTFIHSAVINTGNIANLNIKSAVKDSDIAKLSYNSPIEHYGVYLWPDVNAYGYKDSNYYNSEAIKTSMPLADKADSNSTFEEDLKNLKRTRKQEDISQEELEKLPSKKIEDDGKQANEDKNVLKTLKNNPIWDALKIRTKKTRPFTPLSTKELEKIALDQIEKEKAPFHIAQDFLNITNTNIKLDLSFAKDMVALEIPTFGLHLESKESIHIAVSKIENILRYSPLAQYYGITHGSFKLHIPYVKTIKEEAILFTLDLDNLQYPLYTIDNKRLKTLNLSGHFKDNTLVILGGDNIDFKSEGFLSMLRINGYRMNIDEAYKSKIPFFIDLFKDKKVDLPYSLKSIKQEQKLIEIKNKIRKKINISPFDFNVLAENIQFTFLGYTMPLDFANIRFIDDQINMDAQYERGIMNVSMIKDNITIAARNFSGNFINTIITSAKGNKNIIEGGTFSVDALYRGGILNASIEIKNAFVLDLKAVQNMFALIDVVPSLIMFRSPRVSQEGYQISLGKVMLALNDDYLGLQNIFLLGSSMDISGQGIIDLDTEEMNVNLNISTIKNLSRFINRTPIVGYLILGREGQISTNLILTGKYSDPNVNITLAKDIIKAPFNIVRRVFPIDMLEGDDDINY